MGCQPSKSDNKTVKAPLDLKLLKSTPGMFVGQNKTKITDNYVMGDKVGFGAFGSVKKALCKRTGLERAIKSIKKGADNQEDINLIAEVALLKQLDHPNIMKLLEFYEDSRFYHLVTELYTGGELFDKIVKYQKFTQHDAAVVMRQVLSGITYCHAMKVVHRDLKPENLLLESPADDANIKIIDFGTASTFATGKKLDQVIGTPYYLAPEVLLKKYDEKVDVWSCGVILYILLVGYPPFAGQTNVQIIERVKKGKYKITGPEWDLIDDDAKALIGRMLTTDPQKRISAAQALADQWIIRLSRKGVNSTANNLVLKAGLANLKSFSRARHMETATLTFIASQLTSREEKEQLTAAFQALDVNGDGKLSREELLGGWADVFGGVSSHSEVNAIFDKADTDGSGAIDYTEFLVATLDRSSMLSRKNLRAAFDMFDSDGSGKISKDELAHLFGMQHLTQEAWNNILSGVDQDDDGEVDFEEFCTMMHKLTGEDPVPSSDNSGVAAKNASANSNKQGGGDFGGGGGGGGFTASHRNQIQAVG